MHCHEFENRLNDLLDRRIAPDDDAALCAHARRCAACADVMTAQLALTAALKDLPVEMPGESFPFAVMNRWEAVTGNLGGTGTRSLPVQNQAQAASFEVRSAHGQTAIARATQPKQWLVTSLVSAAAVLIAFALWRGAFHPNGPSNAPPGLAGSSELPPAYDRLAEETQELAALISTLQSEVMNELAEGFKPVTTSFGAAYDAIRRAMPASTASANATSG